jgi:signal transduction histidine kinase
MPLPRPGLRWRLAAGVAAVVIILSVISFVLIYQGTGTQVRHEIDNEISGDVSEFGQMLASAPSHSPAGLAHAALAYVRGQPFSTSSTLLFAKIPGVPAIANRAEFFGRPVVDRGDTVPEAHAEDRESAGLLSAPDGVSTVSLPDVGPVRLVKRTLVLGGQRIRLGVGEPLAPVRRAQNGVARAYVLAGLITLLGAFIAAYLIGSRFSRPLRRMAAVAARVDAGDLHPRIRDHGAHAEEITVLADSFNHMLDRLSEAFDAQRAFIADASHELRTPLTAIRGQLEVLAESPSPSRQDVERVSRIVRAEVARTTRLVDDMLLLARAEQTEFLIPQHVQLTPLVEEIWSGSTLMADRDFQLREPPEATLVADPDRLAQALRNLVNNAIEHTASGEGIVRLSVELAGREATFVVEDDGPGIPIDQRERVFDRFYRTDAARDRVSGGTGLGLAIVRAIAEAHGGSVAAGGSVLGGARMSMRLPIVEQRSPRGAGLSRPPSVGVP